MPRTYGHCTRTTLIHIDGSFLARVDRWDMPELMFLCVRSKNFLVRNIELITVFSSLSDKESIEPATGNHKKKHDFSHILNERQHYHDLLFDNNSNLYRSVFHIKREKKMSIIQHPYSIEPYTCDTVRSMFEYFSESFVNHWVVEDLFHRLFSSAFISHSIDWSNWVVYHQDAFCQGSKLHV